jgi:TonB family protein
MNGISTPNVISSPRKPAALALLLAFAFLLAAFSSMAYSQGGQLSLADILVALRSKKASLPDRNKILSDAVATRGTTFTLTPEIEKELSVTGANKALLDSIRQRAQILKVASVQAAAGERKTDTADAPQSPAPDAAYYEQRGSESVAKGDLDTAIIEFTRAIEMNGDAVNALMGRANSYFGKSLYMLAIADFGKVIELDPKNAAAYSRRGQAYEKKGNAVLALEDYKKAFELDPAEEISKTAVTAWRDREQAAAAAARPVVVPQPALPEYVDLGALTEDRAIKMVKPVFTAAALQAGVGGQVVLDVELDTEGNVVKTKVVSGHQFLRRGSEDAARRSQFKPAMIGDKAIKAKGRIVYNFVARTR